LRGEIHEKKVVILSVNHSNRLIFMRDRLKQVETTKLKLPMKGKVKMETKCNEGNEMKAKLVGSGGKSTPVRGHGGGRCDDSFGLGG
jgi:hypothetical protein